MHLRLGADDSVGEIMKTTTVGDKELMGAAGYSAGKGATNGKGRRYRRYHQEKPGMPSGGSDVLQVGQSSATQRRLLTGRVHFNSHKGVRPGPALNDPTASPSTIVKSQRAKGFLPQRQAADYFLQAQGVQYQKNQLDFQRIKVNT